MNGNDEFVLGGGTNILFEEKVLRQKVKPCVYVCCYNNLNEECQCKSRLQPPLKSFELSL